ncbi:MAG: CARDB domain-containing protein, partial [Acidobacteriota bacterium]
MNKKFLCENPAIESDRRLRSPRRWSARLAAVAALAVASLSTQPAAAQLVAYDEACYSILADPPRGVITIGERAEFDLSIVAKEDCRPVEVERWTFSTNDDRLLIIPDPAPGKVVGVEALDGALYTSYLTARAELTSRLTLEPVATVERRIQIRVSDGIVELFNLHLDSFTAPPHAIAGRDFTATARVSNQFEPTTVSVINTLRIGEVERSAACPPLDRFAACTQDFTLTAPENPGRYGYSFCADATDAITEWSEDDNCVIGILDVRPVTVVDLAADGLVISPAPTRVGQPTQVTAVSRNLGVEPSGAFGITVETPDGLFVGDCPGLESLATCSRTFAWEPTETGLQTLRFQIVNPNGGDADPLNDRLLRNVEVAEGPSLPDFTVLAGDIRMTPAAPRVGEAVTFEVDVTNIGAPYQQDPSEAPLNRITLAGSVLELPCLPDFSLDPGESCTTRFTRTLDDAGQHVLSVRVDDLLGIPESDERNNFSNLRFIVDEAGSNVTCQGNWSLIGIGSTTFNTTSPGSVVDNCQVFFGRNRPTGCWRTVGDGDLQVTWHRASGSSCPTSATVTEPQEPFQTWTFDVFI